jgi:hypothetical protein
MTSGIGLKRQAQTTCGDYPALFGDFLFRKPWRADLASTLAALRMLWASSDTLAKADLNDSS